MNKDKIIKDLKEKNRKLKNQYELQEVRLCSSQHKVDELKEQIENQAEIIRKQSEKIIPENIDLHNRISKTLEELDKQITFCENDSQGCYEVCNQTITFLKKIKNILIGENDE